MKIWLSNSLIQWYILDNKQSSHHILPIIPVINKSLEAWRSSDILDIFFITTFSEKDCSNFGRN